MQNKSIVISKKIVIIYSIILVITSVLMSAYIFLKVQYYIDEVKYIESHGGIDKYHLLNRVEEELIITSYFIDGTSKTNIITTSKTIHGRE